MARRACGEHLECILVSQSSPTDFHEPRERLLSRHAARLHIKHHRNPVASIHTGHKHILMSSTIMDTLLTQLRACADPTRLRLLALCAGGAFCVGELTTILGQSQPRLSRHLKLLTEAGLLECSREGAHAWFSATPGKLPQTVLALLPAQDGLVAADRRAAARVRAERVRAASADFRRRGAGWDEMGALGLPTARAEDALLGLLTQLAGDAAIGALLDLGTGTGRLLELAAPLADHCLGIDTSPGMLALARDRLSRAELANCRVRQADAYRLPSADGAFDCVLAQMVLHHADDPAAMLAEAARVLRPGGMMVVIDLEAGSAIAGQQFRWPGFANAQMRALLVAAGLRPLAGAAIPGPIAVRLWPARRAPAPPALLSPQPAAPRPGPQPGVAA